MRWQYGTAVPEAAASKAAGTTRGRGPQASREPRESFEGGLEEGLKSEMGEAAFDEAMMEEVEMEDETPSPASDADKKTGMI